MAKPIIRFDNSESDDSGSGELIHVTDEELAKISEAPGNEVVMGDPSVPAEEQQADFTVFNNTERPNN